MSQQQNDDAMTNLNQVTMQQEVAKQTYDKAAGGARTEDKTAANALVAQADAMIKAAQAQVLVAEVHESVARLDLIGDGSRLSGKHKQEAGGQGNDWLDHGGVILVKRVGRRGR